MAFRYFESPTYVRMRASRKPHLLLVEPRRLFADALTRLLRPNFYVKSLRPGGVSAPHDIILIDEDIISACHIDDIVSSNRTKAPICLLSLSPSNRPMGGEHVHCLSKALGAVDFLAAVTSIARESERSAQQQLFSAPPNFDDLDVSSTFLLATPEEGVGGDWYDVMYSHGRMAFVIGDVAGHGQNAAITANLIRERVAKLLMRNLDPASILSSANALLLKNKALQATAICGYVNPRSREIVYACAGHPPPIVAHEADAAFEPYGGMMLGVDERAAYTATRMTAPERGLFVVYTDGVTELRGTTVVDGDEVLLDAVRVAVVELSDSARAIQDAVFKGKLPIDDASILAIAFGNSAALAKEYTLTPHG